MRDKTFIYITQYRQRYILQCAISYQNLFIIQCSYVYLDTLHNTGISNGAMRTVNISASASTLLFVTVAVVAVVTDVAEASTLVPAKDTACVTAAPAVATEVSVLSARSPGLNTVPKESTLILFVKAASGDRCVHRITCSKQCKIIYRKIKTKYDENIDIKSAYRV